MTRPIRPGHASMMLVQPFPQPGRLVQFAYRELDLATSRQQDHLLPLRDLATLPRPWDPATCQTPQLRNEVWSWLEAVVTWLNHEHVWDVADVIPTCWLHHPHLVHEIAVLADQRHRASQALTSDTLEDWHRHSLPSFIERMRSRLRNHCQEDHQSWPAKGRYTRHLGEASRLRRMDAYAADVPAAKSTHDQDQSPRWNLLILRQARSNSSSTPWSRSAAQGCTQLRSCRNCQLRQSGFDPTRAVLLVIMKAKRSDRLIMLTCGRDNDW
jgi:hypothetical protein